ncbi:MAG: LysM peptidoglycan-binding domain-containing protein [Planctomycetota bacterium]
MTRESKLALIVGFSVMLLVGVLISDHLSRARLDGTEPRLASSAQPDDGGVIALQPLTLRQERSSPAPVLPEPRREVSAPRQAAADSGPVVLDQSWWSESPAVAQRSSVSESAGEHVAEPLPDPEDSALAAALRAGASMIDRVRNAQLPVAAHIERPRREPSPVPEKQPVGSYKVQAGDTLFRLAARYMGSGHRWREIQSLNSEVLKGSTDLSLGMTLQIPGAPGIEQRPAKGKQPPPTRQRREYKVRPGDTLGEICQRELGTVKKLQAVLAANSDLISDADDIRVGMVLVLPEA